MWGNHSRRRRYASIVALIVGALVVPGVSPAQAATSATDEGPKALQTVAKHDGARERSGGHHRTDRPGRRLAKGKGKHGGRPTEPTHRPIPDQPPAPPTTTADIIATLVKTIDLSAMKPPSSDASDVAYDPNTDRLIVVDGEIDEPNMSWLYKGVNVFNMTRQGVFMSGGSTTLPNPIDFSKEPVGASFIPQTNTLLISDDNQDDLSFVKAGRDAKYGTSDDVVRELRHVIRAFAGDRADPEGLAYDTSTGDIWIIDGVNAEVWRWKPGPNGRFDDTASGATSTAAIDDVFTHFDTAGHGLADAEGIAHDGSTNTLLCLGVNGDLIYRFGKAGGLIETIDISRAGAVRPSGLALAPSSLDPSKTSLWITDRGIDNGPLGTEPTTQNDGTLYEMTLGAGTATAASTQTQNLAPVVRITSPTATSTYTTDAAISLTGSARDPEGSTTTILWRSSIDGRIGRGTQASARLSAGTHVITLAATDRSGHTGTAKVRIRVADGSVSIESAPGPEAPPDETQTATAEPPATPDETTTTSEEPAQSGGHARPAKPKGEGRGQAPGHR